MKVYIQGLIITTNQRYVKISIDKELNIVDDDELSALIIYIPKNFNSKYIVDKRVEVINPRILKSTDYIKITNPRIDFNGLILTKLTPNDYSLRQFLVKDIDSFLMKFDDKSCTILIPFKSKGDIVKYVDLISKNKYLKVLSSDDLKSLNDINSFIISDKDSSVKSTNTISYNSKKFYQRYLLSMIDVQESFVTQLRSLLKNYGIELVRYPIDRSVKQTNRLIYRFTELDKHKFRKSGTDDLKSAVQHTANIDFEISCTDLILLTDLKTRYQNLDFLSNFTTFYTKDTLGRNWISNIEWGVFPTEFNQDYSTDNQSNIGFSGSFSATINYYVVYDVVYNMIQSTIINIFSNNETSDTSEVIIIE